MLAAQSISEDRHTHSPSTCELEAQASRATLYNNHTPSTSTKQWDSAVRIAARLADADADADADAASAAFPPIWGNFFFFRLETITSIEIAILALKQKWIMKKISTCIILPCFFSS